MRKLEKLEKQRESIRDIYKDLGTEMVNIKWNKCLHCAHFHRDESDSSKAACDMDNLASFRCKWHPDLTDHRTGKL